MKASSLMSFQAVLSNAYKYADKNTFMLQDEVRKSEYMVQGRKGGLMLQESARRLRDLLPFLAANHLSSRF